MVDPDALRALQEEQAGYVAGRSRATIEACARRRDLVRLELDARRQEQEDRRRVKERALEERREARRRVEQEARDAKQRAADRQRDERSAARQQARLEQRRLRQEERARARAAAAALIPAGRLATGKARTRIRSEAEAVQLCASPYAELAHADACERSACRYHMPTDGAHHCCLAWADRGGMRRHEVAAIFGATPEWMRQVTRRGLARLRAAGVEFATCAMAPGFTQPVVVDATGEAA